jgi:hypothetical protein
MFAQEELDFDVLPYVTDEHLCTLGLPLKDRIALLAAIARKCGPPSTSLALTPLMQLNQALQ